MESYEALNSPSLSDSSRIQTLQRSISVHEVAIASLKGEFERQNSELVAAEDEVTKLRQALDKKASYNRLDTAGFSVFHASMSPYHVSKPLKSSLYKLISRSLEQPSCL